MRIRLLEDADAVAGGDDAGDIKTERSTNGPRFTLAAKVMNDQSEAAHVEEITREGERALERKHRGFEDWVAIAKALNCGREQSERLSASSRARVRYRGKLYNQFFGMWLDAHPKFRVINSATRTHLYTILENLQQIQVWRDTLSEEERFHCNDPGRALRKWREQTGQPTKPKKRHFPTLRERVVDLEDENSHLRIEVEQLHQGDVDGATVKDDPAEIARAIDERWPINDTRKAREITEHWLRFVREREAELLYH